MRILSVSLFCTLLACSTVAQESTPAKPAEAQGSSAESKMDPGIEAALKKYVAAYEGHSVQNLLAVWPDVQNQKKEFGKIRQHLEDANISDEHMSLRPLQTQTSKDEAIVQCERTDKFSKTETKTEFSGDLNMGASPVQSPPPSSRSSKKAVNKTDKVWIKLHKDHDDWVIAALSEKPLSF